MSTHNGKSFTSVKNLNLRGGAEGPGLLRWSPVGIYGQNTALWASNPFGTTDYGLYINSAGSLVFSSAGSTTILGAAGSGGSLPTWDQIFVGDQALDVGGTNSLTVTTSGTGSNNVFVVTSSASNSGNLIQITNTGSGSDIAGTSNTWNVSKAGAAVFTSAAIPTLTATTITATTNTLTLAAVTSSAIVIGTGSNTVTLAKATTASSTFTVTDGVVTLSDTSNVTGLLFTSSATTAGVSGASTGTAVFRSTSLTTGTLLKLQLTESTLTTGWYLVCYDAGTTAAMFTVAKYGATTITGTAYGTAALTLTSGDIVLTAGAINHTAVGATTANGFTGTYNGLTTGVGMSLVHTTSVIADGGSLFRLASSGIDTGGATNGALFDFKSTAQLAGTVGRIDSIVTTGTVLSIIGTGTMLTTGNLLTLTGNSATTAAGLLRVNANGLTSGSILKVVAAAATLTTGFYFAANDGALNTFTVGANGHLTSNQTTAPTAGTNATGISAVAVTAASTDTCGTITTTGTPASGTVLTITFNKTYTTAPKYVSVAPANAAAGGVNTMPIITQTATTFVLTWPASGVYAATPSYTYLVVA